MAMTQLAVILLVFVCVVNTLWLNTLKEVFTAGLAEDTPKDTVLGRLVFNSPDSKTVLYSSENPLFKVNPLTGEVILTETLVFRTMNNMVVTFSAKDGLKDASLQDVVLIIIATNHPPNFDSPSYLFSFKENAAVGSRLYKQINVIEPDEGFNGTVDVACISSSQICDFFGVSSSAVDGFDDRLTVTIELKSAINANIQPKNFKITATDRGTPPLTTSADVSFIVENSFNNRPVFKESPYIIQINENSLDPNKDLINVEIEDSREKNNANNIKLSIMDDSMDAFVVGEVIFSGVFKAPIRLKKALNIQDNNFNTRYSFRLKATQTINGQDTQTFSETFVSVNIVDMNDITPTFQFKEYTGNVIEGLPNGASVPGLLMIVSDEDAGDNSQYEVTLETQSPLPEGVFAVSPSEGQGTTGVGLILTRPSFMKYQLQPELNTHRLIARVRETKTAEKRSSSTFITIQVAPPANNRPPFFSDILNPITIPKATPVGSIISTVIRAEDSDSGINGKITYKITNETNSRTYFTIDGISGVLSLRANLKDAGTTSFTFDVIATDGGGLSATTEIRIEVIDKEGPIFNPSSYQVSIFENTRDLIPELKIKAELGSLLSDRVVQYTFVESGDFNVSEYFQISSEGVVTVKKEFDYTDTPRREGFFELQVEASVVNYNNIPTNKANIKVYVIDTNNHPPIFIPNSNYHKSINETYPPDTSVLRLKTTDSDVGLNAQVRYLLLDGARNHFILEEGGLLKTSNNTNFRHDRPYEMKVLAIDEGQPPMSATAIVSINVEDVIQDTPTFNTNQFIFIVGEGAKVDQNIGFVRAESTEGGAKIRYTFVQDSWIAYDQKNKVVSKSLVSEWFRLNELTGEIRVNNKLSYNEVAKTTVNVSAHVTNFQSDANPDTAYVPVTINIIPANTDRVVFSPSQETFYIQITEQLPIGTTIFEFQAYETTSNSAINDYVLTHTNPHQTNPFRLDPNTGVLKVIREIIYIEIASKNYTFILKARSLSTFAEAQVIINIKPLSSNPVFQQKEYTFIINNQSPERSVVGVVKAMNPYNDQPVIQYSLSNPSSFFTINPTTGRISLLKRLTPQQILYNIFVKATSKNSTNSFSSDVLVNVRVERVKTQMPQFEASPYNFVVPINSKGLIGRVVAFDPSPYNPSNIIYSIPADSPLFRINQNTGIIEATTPLNMNIYKLNVTATASDNKTFSNTTTLEITTFSPSSQTPTFTEPHTSSVDAYANDPASFKLHVEGEPSIAGRTLTYSLLEDDQVLQLFNINSNSGLLTFKPSASMPSRFQSYELILKIDDGISSQLKKLRVDVFANNSPTFLCYDAVIIMTAQGTSLTPIINIPSPSQCSDNHPSTMYYFKIIKINNINYEDSDMKYTFVLNKFNNSAFHVKINNTHKNTLLIRDNLKYTLVFAVGNSEGNLRQNIKDGSTSSFLQARIQIDPFFSPGPRFNSSRTQCPGSGKRSVVGLLDLAPVNTPVFKIKDGDCDVDPARPNKYTIDKVTYKGPADVQSGEPSSYQGNPPFVINSETDSSGLILTNIPDFTLYYRGHFNISVSVKSTYGKKDSAVLTVYILRASYKFRINYNSSYNLSNLTKQLNEDHLRIVTDQASSYVDSEGRKTVLSQCYFLVDNRYNNVTTTPIKLNNLNDTNIISFNETCYKPVESTQKWGGNRAYWWVLIAFSILVFLLALILSCCVCFFWPMNVREMAKARPYIVLDEPPMSMAGSVFDYK